MIKKHIPQDIKNIYHLILSVLANLIYGFPSRKLFVIGVTGTDGKTTTATLIYEIMKKAKIKTALVTTVSAYIDNKTIDTGFHVTSPNPFLLQKLMKEAVVKGCTHIVLEVTSHGLDQHRFWGISFEIGVITNVTHEHLDYHKSFLNYVNTKAKLVKTSKKVVLNKDDESFKLFKKSSKNENKVISYAISKKADFTAKKVKTSEHGLEFVLTSSSQNYSIKSNLHGIYNCSNILAAVSTCSELKIKTETVRKALKDFGGVSGRLESVDMGQKFKVYIDFAHTPNSLQKVLVTLKSELDKNAKLIVVFGCAGERDILKRPIMAKISTEIAEVSIFTEEDPRSEKLKEILNQMVNGVKKEDLMKRKHLYLVIPDRKKAIHKALKLANDKDIVVICGKGHEKSMSYENLEVPWSDQKITKEALNEFI